MSQTQPYRVALVGCGAIAESGHLPALRAHPRFDLVACCDVRPERARLLAGQAGGMEALSDAGGLLGRADLDGVVLALHPEHSVEWAIRFLGDGKAVLDEKPLAASLAEGRRLRQAVRDSGRIYQLGFVFRYCEMVEALGELARAVGTPALYRVEVFDERLNRADMEHFGRLQQCLAHSSAVNHEGSHVLDYVRLWNPSPYQRASASAIRTASDLAGPNVWSVRLDLADGSLLELTIGWLLPGLPPCTASLVGPHGSVSVDLFSGEGVLRRSGRAEPLRLPPLRQAWERQLDAFAAALDTGRPAGATVEDGLAALAAAQACEVAAREQRVVEL